MKINTVTCGVWVAQGKAMSNPEKVINNLFLFINFDYRYEII